MKGRIIICDYCGTPADFVDSSVVYHGPQLRHDLPLPSLRCLCRAYTRGLTNPLPLGKFGVAQLEKGGSCSI